MTGLPSYAAAGGGGASGPHAVSLLGRGTAYVTIGLGGNLATRSIMGEGFGRTAQFLPNGNWDYVDDIAGHEQTNNPDGFVPDSNPYAILAEPGQRVITDAGGNDLLVVNADRSVSTLAVFPARPQRNTDSVPTSVVVGPDGAYYVGELSGIPFNANVARIYRVFLGNRYRRTGRRSASSSILRGVPTATSTSCSSPVCLGVPGPEFSTGWNPTAQRHRS